MVPRMDYSRFFARRAPVSFHLEVSHSDRCVSGPPHRYSHGQCCTWCVRVKALKGRAGCVYLSSCRRFVRSRDHRHMLSQTSRERRTTQRAFQMPSGLPHASHSFRLGIMGLLVCVEMVRSVMIATICRRKYDNTLHQEGME